MTFPGSQGARARGSTAGLLWPTLLTLLGLAILIGLGTWQLNRMAEKEALIAKLELRSKAAPVSLDEAMARWRGGDVEYTRVNVRGVVDHGKERYLYSPHQHYGPGYDVFAPMQVGESRYVWLNLGYVPERLKAPETRLEGQAGGETELTGVVRLSAVPNAFTPANDVKENQWYWRDLEGMHASAFDPGKTELVPFFIEAEPKPEEAGGPDWPKPGVSTVVISNRHLGYVLTWYGLALTLFGVYVAFVWNRLKGPRDPA